MNSRRLIASPEAQDRASYQPTVVLGKGWGARPANVRFGSKADIRSAKRHVRSYPKSGHSLAAPLRPNKGVNVPSSESSPEIFSFGLGRELRT